jgi:hypothetical protein
VPTCAIASLFRTRFLPKAISTFACDRAQHSEAASIYQRYSPNLVEGKFFEVGMQDTAWPRLLAILWSA